MKKFVLKIFVFVLVSVSINDSLKSQTGYSWLQPAPTGNSLVSVDFINKDTGIAAGNKGAIIKTTDGGNSWFSVNSEFQTDFNSVRFVNSFICIAAGKSGKIYKSKDCGASWTLVSSGVNKDIFDLDFKGNSTGYAVGLSGTIVKTVNKGNYWFSQNSGTSLPLYCVKFINENTGVAGGYNVILKTTNGGVNWINLNVNISPLSGITSISFSDSLNIVAAGNTPSGDVYRSADGGLNWIKHSMDIHRVFGGSADLVRSISFLNSDTGFAVTSYGTILKTFNGGVNWQKDSSFRPSFDKTGIFENVFVSDKSNIFITGGGGTVLKSSDCCTNWFVKSGFKNDIRTSYFLTAKTGYCAGEKGMIIKTTDFGINWTYQDSETEFNLNAINFSGNNTGYTAGENGIIMKTTDGGNIWSVQKSNTYFTLKGIYFTNALTGFASGGDENKSTGLILKTTNGGEIWNSSYINLSKGIIASVFFTDISNGYACGANGIILKTTDCGLTWNENKEIPFDLHSISFKDSLNGLVCGSDGSVYKTNDGGLNWNYIKSGVYKNLFSVKFDKNGKAVTTGELGTVIISSNNGNSWQKKNTYTYNDLYSSYTDDNSFLTVFGSFGTALRYSETGNSYTPDKLSFEGKEALLFQNFPNPFNPVTTIEYELKSSGNASLKIYDVSGKEFKKLFSGFRNAGHYSVSFSGAGIPSGVYFIELTTSFQSVIKKMILLK